MPHSLLTRLSTTASPTCFNQEMTASRLRGSLEGMPQRTFLGQLRSGSRKVPSIYTPGALAPDRESLIRRVHAASRNGEQGKGRGTGVTEQINTSTLHASTLFLCMCMRAINDPRPKKKSLVLPKSQTAFDPKRWKTSARLPSESTTQQFPSLFSSSSAIAVPACHKGRSCKPPKIRMSSVHTAHVLQHRLPSCYACTTLLHLFFALLSQATHAAGARLY